MSQPATGIVRDCDILQVLRLMKRPRAKWKIVLLPLIIAACKADPPPSVAKSGVLNPQPLIEPVRLDPNRPQQIVGRKGFNPKVCSDVEVMWGRMTADTIIVPTVDQVNPAFELWTNDITLAPDGSIFLADRRDNQLVHASPDGRILKRYGGPGKGPGEFDGAISVALGPDGYIYGGDARGRINVFRPDGEVVRAIQVPGFMEIADMVVLPNGNIVVTTLVEVAAAGRSYVKIISPQGEPVHEVLYVADDRANGERPFMLGINDVRLSEGPEGRFAIWYPVDNFIEVADSTGTLLARIEGCFPRDLRNAYARNFSPNPSAVSFVPHTQGVAFIGPNMIKAATVFSSENGPGIRLRIYNFGGEELDARDFALPRIGRNVGRVLFQDDTTLIGFSDGPHEQGVYRFTLHEPNSRNP